MSEREIPGQIVLHPLVTDKIREIDALRNKLAVLIEEHESLLYGEREILMAQYNRDLGHLEHDLFCLNAGMAELRRRIAILQADLNRGKAITTERIARIDEEIQEEFEKARAEIEERERQLRQSGALLDSEYWMKPEDVRELKTLYRRLCRRYHPDVGGAEAKGWEQIWSALQRAYREGDLDLLRALAESIDVPGKTVPDTSAGDLDTEIERLRSRIERQGERIAKLLSEPPFSYREKLDDSQWVRARQTELKQEIAGRKERQAELRLRYDALLPPSGTVH